MFDESDNSHLLQAQLSVIREDQYSFLANVDIYHFNTLIILMY